MPVSRHVLLALGAISVIALFMLEAASASADSLFNATSSARQCNALPSDFGEPSLVGSAGCAEVLAAGAPRDVTLATDVPAGSVGFSRLVSFAPASAYEAPGGGLPVTSTVGGLRYSTMMGVLNGPCTSVANIDVVLYNVALPDNPSDPRASTNIVYPRAEGQTDRFGKWRIGAPASPSQGATVVDANADLIADAANLAFQDYPSYLLDYFDPDYLTGSDGPLAPVLPEALYGGMAQVQGEWVPVYVARFAAGGATTVPGPTQLMNSNMGQPFVYVIGDPTVALVSPSNIGDLCTPASVSMMLLGSVGGVDRGRNPAGTSTVFWGSYAASLRDADQDGIENGRDTCPKQIDSGSDTDADGIDEACDTVVGGGSDQDADGFVNRQDNCPQDPNALTAQTESELTVTVAAGGADLGPRADGIGDACDSGSLASSPVPVQNGRPLISSPGLGTVGFSSTVGNGRYLVRSYFIPKCIGGTDADGDGYCAGPDDLWDAAISGCPLACAQVRHKAWAAPSHPANQMDSDGDKWSDAMETYLGTDATKSCAQTSSPSDETPFDNWPVDVVNDNGIATTLDLTGYVAGLNHYIGEVPEATTRLDFNNDGVLTTLDLVAYGHLFGTGRSCGSFGTPAQPPYGPVPAWSQQ